MSQRREALEPERLAPAMPSQIGLVVHPTRQIDGPLHELKRWADVHGAALVQVPASCQQQRVADQGDAEECDLLVSIGGDGTALAAIRAGAIAGRPVLAAACGSLGVLTSVAGDGLGEALERFGRGDWVPRSLPALDVSREPEGNAFALNDVAVARAGAGQVRLRVEVDGGLFARIAGDGCVVSSPIGSSAYSLAAGGPLLAPNMDALLITPLPTHGGSCPSFVVPAASAIRLDRMPGQTAARVELDGQVTDPLVGPLTIRLRPDVATVVNFPGQEPFLAVLRKRRIIADSPRILAEDARR